MKKTERISEIVKRVLKKIETPKENDPPRINPVVDWEKVWSELFPEERRYSYVEGIENNVLMVKINSSTWLMALKQRKEDIKAQLEKHTGKRLSDIKFYR